LARNNKLLDKLPFCHLTQHCRSNKAVDIARILKVSTSPEGIKYKFGIQVPKGINNAIDLDKNSGNQLWEVAIKTRLKQLTDYEKFIGLQSHYSSSSKHLMERWYSKLLTCYHLKSMLAYPIPLPITEACT
jgi:hypothetical protein